jgi:hypothetical protein
MAEVMPSFASLGWRKSAALRSAPAEDMLMLEVR